MTDALIACAVCGTPKPSDTPPGPPHPMQSGGWTCAAHADQQARLNREAQASNREKTAHDPQTCPSCYSGILAHPQPDTTRPVEPPGVAQETARIGMDLLRDTHDNYATYGAQVAQVVGNAYNEGYKAGQAAAGYGLVERHRTLIRRFSEHLVEGHWAASQLLQEARALLDTEKEDGA